MSERILGAIETAERGSYARATLIALERSLRWERGSVEAVLADGEPKELPVPVSHRQVPVVLSAMEDAELIAHLMSTVTELARRLPPSNPRRHVPEDEGRGVVDAGYDGSGYEDRPSDPGRRRA